MDLRSRKPLRRKKTLEIVLHDIPEDPKAGFGGTKPGIMQEGSYAKTSDLSQAAIKKYRPESVFLMAIKSRTLFR